MKFKRLNSIVSYSENPILTGKKHKFMALSVDKSTINNKIKTGIAREITKRKGNVDIAGYVDKSKLIILESKDNLKWKKIKDLEIKGIEKIIKKLNKKDRYFIGLEDPDIINDNKKIKHLYFTIAFKLKNRIGFKVYLGHAQGKTLDNLKATDPVLGPLKKDIDGFKESCIIKTKNKEKLLGLNEILLFGGMEKGVSAVSLSTINKLDKNWKPVKIILDPREMKYPWIMGHASPCCLLPITHKNHLVGIVNGREKSIKKKNKTFYKKFRPGLFLFDPKTKEIPWVSPEPLIEDPKATTITFASDFVPLNKDQGLLYAHVNDSFIRAYKINLKELKKLLPKKI